MFTNHPTTITLDSSHTQNPEIRKLCNQYQPALTDMDNAQRFAEAFSDTVRYVPTRGWFLFSQTHWQPVDTDTMLFLARKSLNEFLDHTCQLTDADTELCDRILKHLACCESLPRLQATLRLVRTIPEMLLSSTKLDADPFQLNMRNGTLNLRISELLPHNPQHYLTHLLPYDYDPVAYAPTTPPVASTNTSNSSHPSRPLPYQKRTIYRFPCRPAYCVDL